MHAAAAAVQQGSHVVLELANLAREVIDVRHLSE